ncbi:hypothetical protein ACLKA6_008512 [Drosophila palustris]
MPTQPAAFVDDIAAEIPGGVHIGQLHLKVLMYADDMVMFADSPQEMQLMIDATQAYCVKWNLQINATKSKVMVVRAANGRLARVEKRNLDGEPLECISEYKYLGNISSETRNEP